jgi:hypothetical protein
MPMQFYVCAYTMDAGCGDWSEILTIVAIDHCDETVENCDWDDFFGEDEEFLEYAYAYIGWETSEDVYHLVWDAPYDPYAFFGTPVGYVVSTNNFHNDMQPVAFI